MRYDRAKRPMRAEPSSPIAGLPAPRRSAIQAVLRHIRRPASGAAAGTAVIISLRDSQDRVVDTRTVRLNAWSSADWTLMLPGEGALGNYSVRAILEADRPKPKTPEQRRAGSESEPGPEEDDFVPYQKSVHASFLVAAYRRPDFRVDVTLTADRPVSGAPRTGAINALYLFGAPMGARPVKWTCSRTLSGALPKAIREKFDEGQWEFIGDSAYEGPYQNIIKSEEATLATTGALPLKLPTADSVGLPWVYTLEGDVEDVSRQHIANRLGVTATPHRGTSATTGPVLRGPEERREDEIVVAGLDGVPVGGVPVEVELTQVQWKSVRRAEGNASTRGTASGRSPGRQVDRDVGRPAGAVRDPAASGGNFVLSAPDGPPARSR